MDTTSLNVFPRRCLREEEDGNMYRMERRDFSYLGYILSSRAVIALARSSVPPLPLRSSVPPGHFRRSLSSPADEQIHQQELHHPV